MYHGYSEVIVGSQWEQALKERAICWCFTVFLCQTFTMARLSQQKQILLPCSHWAHVVAATRWRTSPAIGWIAVIAIDMVASHHAARHLKSMAI